MKGKYRWKTCISCRIKGKEKYRKDLGYILVCPKCGGLIDINNKKINEVALIVAGIIYAKVIDDVFKEHPKYKKTLEDFYMGKWLK
jgi:PHP family Zn ribbon phosphoesterase